MASKNQNPNTKPAKSDEKLPRTAGIVPEGFGDDELESYRSGVDLYGFYSPRSDRMGPDGDHIYGTVVRCVERKDPGPQQHDKFVILTLAAPVTGLIFTDDRDDEPSEGVIPAGEACGIDIRQAYSMLAEERFEGCKVHLHFKGKVTIGSGKDKREFWDVDVRCSPPKSKAPALPPNGATNDDVPNW